MWQTCIAEIITRNFLAVFYKGGEMKKRILSVLLGCSFLFGTIFAHATMIEFEEIDSNNSVIVSNTLFESIEELESEEIIETKLYENNLTKVTTAEEGTLEYVKTIIGNSYTAFTKKDANHHYWSQSYGYENTISDILKDTYANPDKYASLGKIDAYKNWGSTSQDEIGRTTKSVKRYLSYRYKVN